MDCEMKWRKGFHVVDLYLLEISGGGGEGTNPPIFLAGSCLKELLVLYIVPIDVPTYSA